MNYKNKKMSYKIHPDLKPLSANLKKLKVGLNLLDGEFLFDLEEYDLDELWKTSFNIASRSDYTHIIYTETFIIGLNEIYLTYTESFDLFGNSIENLKTDFHNFFLIIFENYLKNESQNKNYNGLLSALEILNIVDRETYEKILDIITSKKYRDDNLSIHSELTMNKNQNKKYQIFISSTFIDLKEERQAAVEAILKKGHIPAGMELFTAGDKSQWEVIKKWIDDSDIYLLILGGRYGSIDETTRLSYTEMEYNYAIEKGKPFFALSLTNEILDKKPIEIIKDFDLKNPKYIAFKEKITKKMCAFPKNNDQIKNEINHSLDTLISENKEKMEGWIKGNI